MGNLSNNAIWEDDINQIETTDPLLGGVGGPMNIATQQLANRTAYLKYALQGFVSVGNWDINHAFTPAELFSSLIIINADNKTLSYSLPDSADLGNPVHIGLTAVIKAINVNKSQVVIAAAGTDKIINGFTDAGNVKTKIFLGSGDSVRLVFTALGWEITEFKGYLDEVGEMLYQYKERPNTVIAQGQILNRADYPRLWEYAQTLGSSLITDAVWTGVANNKGFYSTGNSTTTFRMPDLRGMFIRSLDLSAGIDTGRISNIPGAYEADEIKAHSHPLTFDGSNDSLGGANYVTSSGGSDGTSGHTLHAQIGNTGGAETRPKNIGLLPLIKV